MKQTNKAQNRARIAKAGAAVTTVAKGVITVKASASLNDLVADLCTPTGVPHDEIAIRIVDQIANSLHGATSTDADMLVVQAIRTIDGLSPKTLTEAMLAAQTIAAHEASLMFLRRATMEGQTTEGADANVLRATRLMRLQLDQIEAMQKLKGKTGQQKVAVEHVHVYQGGQAIVGSVDATPHPRGGGQREN